MTSDHARLLQVLASLSRMVAASLDLEEGLRVIASTAAELMEVPGVACWIADETAEAVELRAFSDPRLLEGYETRRLRVGEGAIGWVAEARQPLAIEDAAHDCRRTSGTAGI